MIFLSEMKKDLGESVFCTNGDECSKAGMTMSFASLLFARINP